MTRGKQLVVLVGQKKAVGIAVRGIQGRRRWSKLKELLVLPDAEFATRRRPFRKFHVLGHFWRFDWGLMRRLIVIGAATLESAMLPLVAGRPAC